MFWSENSKYFDKWKRRLFSLNLDEAIVCDWSNRVGKVMDLVKQVIFPENIWENIIILYITEIKPKLNTKQCQYKSDVIKNIVEYCNMARKCTRCYGKSTKGRDRLKFKWRNFQFTSYSSKGRNERHYYSIRWRETITRYLCQIIFGGVKQILLYKFKITIWCFFLHLYSSYLQNLLMIKLIYLIVYFLQAFLVSPVSMCLLSNLAG